MPATGGVRVALDRRHRRRRQRGAAPRPTRRRRNRHDPASSRFGGESRIIFEYQDDNLTLFYLLEVVNNARTPIDIGGPLIIELPTGAAGRRDDAGIVAAGERSWRRA